DIDVEVQVEMHHDLWKRWQYYTLKMYTEGIRSGEAYSGLKHAVRIVILDGSLIKGDAVYHHRFRLYDAENNLAYPDSMEINLLEIPKRKDDGTALSRWLDFFAARSEEDFMSLAHMNPAMDEAWGVIKYLSGDEQERAMAESREKARRDLVAMYDTGREEGREEGVQLGEEKACRRIAMSMLNLGISEDKILAATGFSREQLTKLKDSV
ncbi:MAG: Rpn family recombination-promoting nuclease/putative transposase, partial [Desulfovibrio sp.]|nr:Rpn family recombination-promoting nuclease/putative transposase [Desulfovibrio sp.]